MLKGGCDDGVVICVKSMDYVVDWEVHCKVFFSLFVGASRKEATMYGGLV